MLQIRPRPPKRVALNLPWETCACGCGKIFKPKRRGQRFATRQCRFKHHNARKAAPWKTCPHCGKDTVEEGKRPK